MTLPDAEALAAADDLPSDHALEILMAQAASEPRYPNVSRLRANNDLASLGYRFAAGVIRLRAEVARLTAVADEASGDRDDWMRACNLSVQECLVAKRVAAETVAASIGLASENARLETALERARAFGRAEAFAEAARVAEGYNDTSRDWLPQSVWGAIRRDISVAIQVHATGATGAGSEPLAGADSSASSNMDGDTP